MILLGTLLLMLPVSSREGLTTPFPDALFTATSASCVTGLIVADTGTYFSMFGQVVILLMIQIGGLGFMTVSMLLFTMTGRKVSLHERMSIAEGLGESRLQGVVQLSRTALLVTFLSELIGAALLSIRFIPAYGPGKGVWLSVFTSVSAFCNAGFDLIGGYRSLTGYASDPLMLFTVMALIVTGGLGFTVIVNMQKTRRFRALRLHTKLVLVGTGVLLVSGAALILLIEYDNPGTLEPMPFLQKLMNALFQSVTLRTAGFNTFDQLAQRDASKAVGVILMLCGGAPAGTAGGLKITTVFTLLLAVRSYFRGRTDAVVFGRTIPAGLVRRALTIFFTGLAFLFSCTIVVCILEQNAAAGALGLINQLYETTSAMCTVGISCGVTAIAGTASRMIMALMMYVGRVGLITLVLSLSAGAEKDAVLHYPSEDILIG